MKLLKQVMDTIPIPYLIMNSENEDDLYDKFSDWLLSTVKSVSDEMVEVAENFLNSMNQHEQDIMEQRETGIPFREVLNKIVFLASRKQLAEMELLHIQNDYALRAVCWKGLVRQEGVDGGIIVYEFTLSCVKLRDDGKHEVLVEIVKCLAEQIVTVLNNAMTNYSYHIINLENGIII